MLRTFWIKHMIEGYTCGKMTYNEETKEFKIYTDPNCNTYRMPAIMGCCARLGEYELTPEHCRMFIRARVIPPDRQNIGQILKKFGLKEYDEFEIMMINNGWTCQDDFIFEEII